MHLTFSERRGHEIEKNRKMCYGKVGREEGEDCVIISKIKEITLKTISNIDQLMK